ncbi:MAG TPA: SPFH domain-containing protein [Fimbriimonadaceae bacterium]|nr:SPFH domain-containing protein [Fimbriimonadaceae bacterium]
MLLGQTDQVSLNGDVVIAAIIVVVLLVLLGFIKSMLQICPPNEVLIFSGRKRRLADGSLRGCRTVFGGRGFRWPIFETVSRMSLNVMEVPITIKGAYSKGGIALNVEAIANVKISSDEVIVNNAIERFLGRDPNEIKRVAKETLEGHLRGVLSRLTPEEVNEDRLKFADELATESEMDLRKLGIHLDTFKIQHVSDDKHYLDSIGRGAVATVIRDAEIAESDAMRAANQAEAENRGRANVVKANVDANIAKLVNELRRVQADLDANVKSEEERTLAAAREARAKAEQELQQVRAELEGIRLQADQVIPAEALLRAQEYKARGDAAILRERGVAASQALELMNSAWSEAGESALTIYLIEDFEKILAGAAKGVSKMKVGNLQMIDGGDGKVLSSYISSYPAMLSSVFEAVAQSTGIDIPKAISGNGAASGVSSATTEVAK